MMKRLLAAVLAMMMILPCAVAEEETKLSFGTYAQSFAELTEESGEVWEADDVELLQTLAVAEGVTVSACLEGENIASVTAEFPCGEASEEVRAVIGNLSWLSAEAMEQVLSMEEGAVLEIEGCTVYRVHGKTRDAFSVCRSEDAEGMLWQPVHGGERIHDTPRCSGMDVSRMITAEAALLIGWEDCGICRAAQAQTEEASKAQNEETDA